MGKGSNRDWGYASYTDDGRLIYTSYENDGSVNRYTDNGDGGHSHEHWNSKDDYNAGKDADQARYESNKSPNPSTGEIQSNGGCYLTTACMKHYLNDFDDSCYELTVLRWFRDNYVSKEDINHYYEVAPLIVEEIDKDINPDMVYNYIYDNIVDYCVNAIENFDFNTAYNRYKDSIIHLEKTYLKQSLRKRKKLENK